MSYVLVKDGVVVQKQPNAQDGFIEVPDAVHCGQLYDGTVFTNPPPAPVTPRQEITRLEAEVSPRRIRESVLGTDGGWLAAQEALIATQRGLLT